MGRRAAGELVLSDAEREALVALIQASESAQALALRAQIILECSAGLANKVVAAKLRVVQQTVGKWRARYIEHRLDGLLDAPRTGAPSSIDDSKVQAVIAITRESLLLGTRHWTSRTLAKEVGVSPATVLRIWRASRLQPHPQEIIRLGSDPEPREKTRPIGGSDSISGNATPASTDSACEIATPAADRARIKTNTSHTMEDRDKKSIEKVQLRAEDQGASQIPKQAGRSNPPKRKIIDRSLAAAGDPITIISRPRGRKTGEGRSLSDQQSQRVFKTICDERPDGERLNLGQPLWNISAVSRLVQQDCGLSLDRSTVTRYLERWGIIAEHPFEFGLSKREREYSLWAYSAYPEIEALANTERGDIFWFFEDNIYPDNVAHPEPLPEIEGAPSGGLKLLSIIQGQLRCPKKKHLSGSELYKRSSWREMPTPPAQVGASHWLVLRHEDPVERMQRFMKALVRHSERSGRKVFLFVPDENKCTVDKLADLLAHEAAHIEVFFLPPW